MLSNGRAADVVQRYIVQSQYCGLCKLLWRDVPKTRSFFFGWAEDFRETSLNDVNHEFTVAPSLNLQQASLRIPNSFFDDDSQWSFDLFALKSNILRLVRGS